MKKKEYWVYGLIIGFIVYLLIVLYVFLGVGDGSGIEPWGKFATFLYAVLFSPVILFGLLVGWIYGKIKNRNKSNIVV